MMMHVLQSVLYSSLLLVAGLSLASTSPHPMHVLKERAPACDPYAEEHLDIMDKMGYSPSFDRAKTIQALVTYLKAADIPGDYVETGVFQGTGAAAVSSQLVALGMDKRVKMWLYDSWEGLPDVQASDGKTAQQYVGKLTDTSVELVASRLNETGLDVTNSVIFRKGWFNTTFKMPKPPVVAFLHVDGDWYSSVHDTLRYFYERVPVGGVVLLDDFGFWEGCRKAFYDYFHARCEYPLLERVGVTQAYFIKGKEHNRASVAINHSPLPA